ncbi:MAG: DUF899 domain-containing protein [Chitinophagaceae bacterium]|nr:MAG: DUF899 domain-containing protein [Chitinophagaceae bacterium]
MQKELAIHQKIEVLEKEIMLKKEELSALRKQVPFQEVKDYLFINKNGDSVALSELFGDKDELIIIHNMGKSCAYCTLWADGLNGMTAYFEDRAGFVVVSSDSYKEMSEFAEKRKWTFEIASSKENTFKKDVGFFSGNHSYPGISVFKKEKSGRIMHTSRAFFGPGDNYCSLWDVFAMLNSEDLKWGPSYQLKTKK